MALNVEQKKVIIEDYKQHDTDTGSPEVQVAILWTVQNGYMDSVAVDRIKDFQAKLTEYLTSRKVELLARIAKEKALSDALKADLKAAVTEFKQTYQ